MDRIYHRIYLAGYGGWQMPRRLRKLIAGTEAHRAWLLGFTGCFEQGGIQYGPAHPYPGLSGIIRTSTGPSKRPLPPEDWKHVEDEATRLLRNEHP